MTSKDLGKFCPLEPVLQDEASGMPPWQKEVKLQGAAEDLGEEAMPQSEVSV